MEALRIIGSLLLIILIVAFALVVGIGLPALILNQVLIIFVGFGNFWGCVGIITLFYIITTTIKSI